MKKRWIVMLSLVTALCATAAWSAHQSQRQLAEKMIRLHVIANSDSAADQALKLEVRDAILQRAEEILTDCEDMTEAEETLSALLPELEEIAAETVSEAGFYYAVSADLSLERYPARTYDSFSLPAGSYLSLRLTIGAGEGKNWWCVVFPPLCNAATTEEFTDSAEAAGLTEEEVALITQESEGYVVRFKLIDWVESLL